MLDSGGFSELSLYGCWETTAKQYAAEVKRWAEEIGGLVAAAAQDWMCEPWMVKRTGLSVLEHQRRSVANFAELRSLVPDLPIFPVLQGWAAGDYLRHLEMYQAAGFNLIREPVVGVGSVCRRQSAGVIEDVVRPLAALGLRLHGFGVKRQGLERIGDVLSSADSLAWSYQARKREPLPGCDHASCANCIRYAEQWRAEVVTELNRPRLRQLVMVFGELDYAAA
jgi:hypothetical protein